MDQGGGGGGWGGGLIENLMGNAAFFLSRCLIWCDCSQATTWHKAQCPPYITRSAKLYGNIYINAHIFEVLRQPLLDLIHIGSDQEAEKNIITLQFSGPP